MSPSSGRKRGGVADTRAEHVLHIELAEIEPAIWRDLALPSATTLHVLHGMIQAAFGWTDSHLHEFRVGKAKLVDPAIEPDPTAADEGRFTVADVAPRAGSSFVYEYDFGDAWVHEIRVLEVRPSRPGDRMRRVRCIAGARACPPEDCGGAPGYEELVAALRRPNHARHEELARWVAAIRAELEDLDARFLGPFDPEAFDLRATNAALREVPRC